MSDIEAITQLVARYNHALDGGDGEAWASAFVEDGVFETVGRPPLVGRAAISNALQGRRPFNSRHFVSNMHIELDGDTARMRAYLMVVSEREITVTGSYDDVLRRENGEWLFVHRQFTFDAD